MVAGWVDRQNEKGTKRKLVRQLTPKALRPIFQVQGALHTQRKSTPSVDTMTTLPGLQPYTKTKRVPAQQRYSRLSCGKATALPPLTALNPPGLIALPIFPYFISKLAKQQDPQGFSMSLFPHAHPPPPQLPSPETLPHASRGHSPSKIKSPLSFLL